MRTIEQAAQVMGMKPHREVRKVVETAAGDLVLTHDGQWTLIYDDNAMAFHQPAPPAAAVTVEVESDDDAEPVKPSARKVAKG